MFEKEAEEYAEKQIRHKMARHDIFVKEKAKEEIMEGYLAGAEPREKRIEELETENNKLLDVINNQDVKIADLEKQLEQTKGKLKKARNIIKHLLILIREKELYGVYVSIAQDFMADNPEESKGEQNDSRR